MSRVVVTEVSAGWGLPFKPDSWTFKYSILELFIAFSLKLFSASTVIFVQSEPDGGSLRNRFDKKNTHVSEQV